MIGKILGGRYELLELIGVGGMSQVYKAKCNLLNRFVAVKILKEEYNEDKEFIKRFYIESQAAASLSSPHIVSIYDVGDEDNLHYIVMEYVEGATLKEVIKANGVLAWNVALNFSLQILNALECAHKNGIVHRDIKPHNIIVTDDGVLKVTDFGIARAVNSNETKKIDCDVIGSVHYISPEQAKGIMIDARCDLYSLGIVMYEMLTGKLPFDGDNPVSVALMHLSAEPVSIKEHNLSVPNELVRIVTKSMQRDVLNRYQSAKEMAAELSEFKKVENLATKENEDAFVLETIEMVRLAKMDAEIETPVQSQTIDNRGNEVEVNTTVVNTKRKKEKAAKKKKEPNGKAEKVAFWTAIGASTAIVALIVILLWNVLAPNLNSSMKPTDKEYFLNNMEGKNIHDVRTLLEEEGFRIVVNEVYDASKPDGYILRQSPYGNITVKVATTELEFDVVSNDKTDEKVAVPRVVNKSEEQAISDLESAGFFVSVIREVNESTKVGYVFDQHPGAEEMVPSGSTIMIYVSEEEEPELITVPSFLGLTKEEAEEQAQEKELKLEFKEKEGTEKIGTVIEQLPAKNSKVEKDSVIQLVIVVEADEPEESPAPDSNESNNASGGSTANNPDSNTENKTPAKEVSQTLTIDLPEDKESVTVVVKRDGTEVYRKVHSGSEKRISVTVTGSGTQKIQITLDGQEFFTQNVKFN